MPSLPLLFMVLASLALLLALVALWSSLRQAFVAAGGQAPALESAELPDRAALLDEKKSLLRAIKDLEYEHAVGKISPEDFKRLDAAYRVRAKEVIARLEQDLVPYQARAEALLAENAPETAREKSPVTETDETDERTATPAKADDEVALRERARALREEAARLERLAAGADAKAAVADETHDEKADDTDDTDEADEAEKPKEHELPREEDAS